MAVNSKKEGCMNKEFNEIARKLYGCDYDSVHMTEPRKALVRRIHERSIKR
jgi:hypothetical protein